MWGVGQRETIAKRGRRRKRGRLRAAGGVEALRRAQASYLGGGYRLFPREQATQLQMIHFGDWELAVEDDLSFSLPF